MFKFITSRPLWVNILFALGLVILGLILFMASLGRLTRHGKILRIPGVTGMTLSEAIKTLNSQGFEVEIQDSIYVENVPPQQVIKQFPEADASVKINRTVYLSVNRVTPPLIDMPNLVGPSFRNAALILKQNGLKLGDTLFRPDFAKNSVLSQLYNGEEVRPGTKIPMGATIDLVLGSGLSDIEVSVPDLFGMTYFYSKTLLDSMGLSFGAKVLEPGIRDTMNTYIYRQSPERYTFDRKINRIRPGQMIDIWLSTEKRERPDSLAKSPDNNF